MVNTELTVWFQRQQSKVKAEMRQPTQSQGKLSAPWDESVNSNLMHFSIWTRNARYLLVCTWQVCGLEGKNLVKHQSCLWWKCQEACMLDINRHFSLFKLYFEF